MSLAVDLLIASLGVARRVPLAPSPLPHARLFAFESDFVASLRCIPMAVRLKLDRCGLKLTLRHWSRLRRDDRQRLLEADCGAAQEVADYGAAVRALVAARTGEAVSALAEPSKALLGLEGTLPLSVKAYACTAGVRPPNEIEWANLDALQRFALIKLSRDNHDNVNFIPALREFGLGLD
jgi:hypothetical protein